MKINGWQDEEKSFGECIALMHVENGGLKKMTQEELQTILEKHEKWLNDVPGGEGANLECANLRGANLRGANLDYSCWPLWCGSLRNVRIDKRIFAQLAYHICRVIVDDDECKAAQRALYTIANQFHRANKCGRLPLEGSESHDD